MGALQGEADDFCGVIDTVAQETTDTCNRYDISE